MQMYLSEIRIKNFRCFGGAEHTIAFNSGLTVIVGENDSGKSAIIDAIRIVMGTTDFGWIRIEPEDFFNEDTSQDISIICKFNDLNNEQQAAFLECLTYETKQPCLYLHWTCRYLNTYKPPRPSSDFSSGKSGNGPAPSSIARELLRATYLRPLRDAYHEMQSGRYSRLSQVIQKLSGIERGLDTYQEERKLEELSLVGIANLANELLEKHETIVRINKEMSDILSSEMMLAKDNLKTKFAVAGKDQDNRKKLITLLEKLDLVVNKQETTMRGQVGLGTSNIMSMACELLLHKDAEYKNQSAFLLIEEPEAHIHAQRQLKLIQSLQNDAEQGSHQIIISTHSPLLASVVKLSNIVMLKNGKTYPMTQQYTKLEEQDYLFLEKYLDATKANLFFARSVIIVEGPGEALLFPTVAKLLGKSFTDYGTSLVDVRSTGLRRYARIFQRRNEKDLLDIKVACVTDRDIMPDCAPKICIDESYSDKDKWPDKERRKWRTESEFAKEELQNHIQAIKTKADGQNVQTFISDHWTLEYDLAFQGLEDCEMQQILIKAFVQSTYARKNHSEKIDQISKMIDMQITKEDKAAFFYQYFLNKTTSKADFAQQLAVELEQKYRDRPFELRKVLPSYVVDAIDYVTTV